jgi:hypothetical protein
MRVAAGSSERAPFVYFDGVATFGNNGGVIQIELAATTIVPEDRNTRIELLVTAHLRCSVDAARSLRDSIDRALQQVGQVAPGIKPN